MQSAPKSQTTFADLAKQRFDKEPTAQAKKEISKFLMVQGK